MVEAPEDMVEVPEDMEEALVVATAEAWAVTEKVERRWEVDMEV